jgi:hypothetical protein
VQRAQREKTAYWEQPVLMDLSAKLEKPVQPAQPVQKVLLEI